MTIRSGPRENLDGKRRSESSPVLSSVLGKDRLQFFRWHHFQLFISAIRRLLIPAPAAKLRHVAKAAILHVLVGDFRH